MQTKYVLYDMFKMQVVNRLELRTIKRFRLRTYPVGFLCFKTGVW